MEEIPSWVDQDAMNIDARLDEQHRWISSPMNALAAPDAVNAQPRRIVLRDDTLRSGANTPGVYASVEKKLRISELLDEAGDRVDLGKLLVKNGFGSRKVLDWGRRMPQ